MKAVLPLLIALAPWTRCEAEHEEFAAPATSVSPTPRATLDTAPVKKLVTAKDGEAFARASRDRSELCPALCAKSEAAGCSMKSAECLAACRKLDQTLVCPDENAAFVRCMVEQPVTHLECMAQGFAKLKTGHCESESQALTRCTQASLAK